MALLIGPGVHGFVTRAWNCWMLANDFCLDALSVCLLADSIGASSRLSTRGSSSPVLELAEYIVGLTPTLQRLLSDS